MTGMIGILKKSKKFMIGAGKWIQIHVIRCNPAEIDRTVQPDRSGKSVTDKHLHLNLEMGIGMFHQAKMRYDPCRNPGFFPDFPHAGFGRAFSILYLSAGKFP